MHIKLTNGVPEKYTIGQLRRDNPQVSFPKNIPDIILVDFNVYPLTETSQPEVVYTQKVEEGTPVLVNGVWTQVWNVVDKTPEEIASYLEQLQQEIASQTQNRLNIFARTRDYDGILSLCTYATSTVPKFAAEGQYGVDARDATWTTLYNILAEVEAGTRPVPSGFEDIESELPILIWPE
jgi:hypothetical protein